MVWINSCASIATGLVVAVCLQAAPVHAEAPQAPGDPTIRATLKEAGAELARTAARISPMVVHIQSDRGRTEETGSGVLMRSSVYNGVFVVTNRHVVTQTPRQNISIRLHDGHIIHPDEVLEDRFTDLAVLKVNHQPAAIGEWGNSDELEIGHFVLAVGSPFGLRQSVTMGIISAKSRRALSLGTDDILNQDFLQTDAAINPGNSGGPLMDLDGKVIGINTAIASQGGGNEGIGFSIPINLVKFVVEELLTKGEVKRGYLGVRLDENFDLKAARRFGLDRLRGARVVEIYLQSPAEAAGFQVNDVIVAVDGELVEDENDLINRVSLKPINSIVPLQVLRGGRNLTLQVTLKERPQKRTGFIPADNHLPALPAGLETVTVTDQLSVQAGHSRDSRGLLVLTVPESVRSQLHLYDIITEVARQPVQTPDDFTKVLAAHPDADSVLLKVRRLQDGRPTDVLVVLPLNQ